MQRKQRRQRKIRPGARGCRRASSRKNTTRPALSGPSEEIRKAARQPRVAARNPASASESARPMPKNEV
jgi:hypothetical protein